EAEVGRPDVSRDDPERVAEQRQRLGDSARGLERAAVVAPFARIGDGEAEARAVADRGDDLLLEPRGVDDDLANARLRERFQVPFDQPPAVHLEQRLRAGVRERPHALATAGGEDDGFHRADARSLPRSIAWRSTDAGANAAINADSSASARAELSAPRLQT